MLLGFLIWVGFAIVGIMWNRPTPTVDHHRPSRPVLSEAEQAYRAEFDPDY